MCLLFKAFVASAVLVLCSGVTNQDASEQIIKLFKIFSEKQLRIVQDLDGIKETIANCEITSGTGSEVLEEMNQKLENLTTSVEKAHYFCEGSNDVLSAFIEELGRDECQELKPECHPDATCIDLLIGYKCACNKGFSGDGNTCEDLNECVLNTNECDAHATCTNNHGSYSCSCNPGYLGDGYSCTERKRCESNNDCQPNASCQNTQGTNYCYCKSGFLGDGRTCEDVDECVDNTFVCDKNATCKNIPGSYSCICDLGFQGDGRTCEDLDECQGSNNCHSDATCTNIHASYSCSCNSGYRGDGYACEDVNECEENNFDCHQNATCNNIPGQYSCSCNSGFKGDGHTCEDVDECVVGHDCHSSATCNNVVGSFECFCIPGYRGDGRQCEDMCPYERINDVGCIVFDNEIQKTWADSAENCHKYGGQLFLATTVSHFNRLRQYLMKNIPFEMPDWTGLWVGVRGQTWMDGRMVSAKEWNDAHCHSSGPCCGSVLSGPPNFLLGSDPCGWSRPSICQWNETSFDISA